MQNIHDTSLKDFVNKDRLQNQRNGLCIGFAQNKAECHILAYRIYFPLRQGFHRFWG